MSSRTGQGGRVVSAGDRWRAAAAARRRRGARAAVTAAVEGLEDRRMFALIPNLILNPPQIDAAGGSQTYSASTHNFNVSAATTDILLSLPPIPGSTFAFINPASDGAQSADIHILVNNDGSLGGGQPGNDLIVTGSVTLGSTTYDGTVANPLLTGEILPGGAFGWDELTPTFNMRMHPTGGQLAASGQIFDGKDVGIAFVDDAVTDPPDGYVQNTPFQQDFTGLNPKMTIAPVDRVQPGPPLITTNVGTVTTPGGVVAGQFATIGFWHNMNGQAVINSFNGGSTATQLGNWLATNFPHLFGASNPYTGTSLAGLTNAQVAQVYSNLWTPSGLQKNTYVQAFAVALGLYADTTSLGGQSLLDNGLAAKYGFAVTAGGAGTFNVGGNGAAFGVANGTSLPVKQILQIADGNFAPTTGLFYGGDQGKTSALNNVLNGINTLGDIPSTGAVQMGTGLKLIDSATLSGGVNPTGTITFYLFAPGVTPDGTYSNNVYTDVVTVDHGNGTYDVTMGTNPGGYAPTINGTYEWVAVYSGDANNQTVTSPFGAEPQQVGPNTPTINTIDGGSILLGSGAKLTDTADLEGAFNPTGTITFYLFGPGVTPNATLSNNVYTNVVTVNGDGVYTTAMGNHPGGYLPTATGTYNWVAVYSGDAANASVASPFGEEPETVNSTTPGLVTAPFVTTTTGPGGTYATIGFWHNKNGQAVINNFDTGPASTLLGTSLASNYANLFGTASNVYTGTSLAGLTNAQVAQVYLNLWQPSGLQKNTYVQAFAVALGLKASGGQGTFNVGANGAAFGVANGTTLTVGQILSAASANFSPGTGLFYGGDSTKTSALNNVLNGINVSGENPGGTPVVQTAAKLNDAATLSGGFNETGTVTFYLFAPGVTPNGTFSNNVYSDVVTVNGNGTYTTASGSNPGGYAATVTGTYQWVAVYSGDGNNLKVVGNFGDEPQTVGQQSPTVLTTVPNVTAAMVGSGSVLKDTADLEMGVNPTGTITFYLFAPGVSPVSDGHGGYTGFLDKETVTVNGNGSTYTTPVGYTLPANAPTGTYQWDAVYSGDANNFGDTFLNDPSERVVVTAPASVSGTVFCDNNLNGVFDAGDVKEAGAVVTLKQGSTVIATKTTDSNGSYTFGMLPAGSYTVTMTTPSGGHLAELTHGAVTTASSYSVTIAAGGSSANNNFAEVDQGSISGVIFLDENDTGTFDSGDVGVAGATVKLTGTDYLGNAVSLTLTTPGSGQFSFTNLLPSSSTGYTVQTTPPAGNVVGSDTPGKLNGVTDGVDTSDTDGKVTNIVIPGCNNDVLNMQFGEFGIFHGATATIGFWHNKNGQALINSFTTTSGGQTLANWLATSFPNLFGSKAPAFNVNSTIGTNLTNRSNADVAAYFMSLFGVTGQKSYAQVLATAFACFTTSTALNKGATGQSLANTYGFNLTAGGTGMLTFTVAQADWAAFGITSSAAATKTIFTILSLTNQYAVKGVLDNNSATLINETNDTFSSINQLGDITG